MIPLCILFAYLFHTFVKESLVLHLPSIYGLNRRAYNLLCTWSLRTLHDWIVYFVSVSVGFLSHIAVDAFTHEEGYMVQQISMLQSIVILELPVYKILQHSLSMIGIAVIIAQIGVALYKTVVAPITGFCAGILLASLPFWSRSSGGDEPSPHSDD
ncbi:DUF4184 family protein [Paenibacillus sp. OV219]|uniref:DUF4184 family protein n=1 Tax=Paenibacillus sp. OV219 TaxID=1884377 RepID=UPI0008BC49EF|nr:DUF4184 family protein [Paenibacillus sp. OV219]SEP14856.1 protein of unknown function [Paenibacillus sp. OV219]